MTSERKVTFEEIVMKKLARYKIEKYPDIGRGKWGKKKGQEKEYDHILPPGYEHLNFLPPYRNEIREFIRKQGEKETKIKLHSPAHMNSSQIMGLNFFYPFVHENLEHCILMVLKEYDINATGIVTEASFEHVPDKREYTNFDFCLKLNTGGKILVETKYRESDFGPVKFFTLKNDKKRAIYEEKYKNTYEPGLRSKIVPSELKMVTVLEFYQLARYVYYMEPDDFFTVIAPEGNLPLKQKFDDFKKILNDHIKPRVIFITWEDMVRKVRDKMRSEANVPQKFFDHLDEFEYKYLRF